MRVVQCLSHSIEAHDQLVLYTSLGIEAVDIGGYIDPRSPHDEKRPPVPGAPFVPELKAAVDALGTPDNLAAAQSHIPDAYLDWLGDDGALIYHHNLHRLYDQWPRIRDWQRGHAGRRVIWRTVGQSVEGNERDAAPFRREGLEIVRYSPKEANIPGYAGQDALIRFYKDPDEWHGWTGEDARVLNISQHDPAPHRRDPWLNWRFWEQATEGLPTVIAGPHSEQIGGLGQLSLSEMQALLRSARVYLYLGTQPASYTLGLIEAAMTGVPIVSIEPSWMTIFSYGPELFEGHQIVGRWSGVHGSRKMLQDYLGSWDDAAEDGRLMRQRAIELFGKATIGDQWRRFLGAPERVNDPMAGATQPQNIEAVLQGVPSVMVTSHGATGSTGLTLG